MIEIQNLYKSFGEKKVLDGLNINIPTGDTMCIIGKSGCGKSVLLKHIVGLLVPDSGRVIIDGKQIDTLSQKEIFALRRQIGFVFQGSALFDSLNVYENVVIGLYEHGVRENKTLEDEAIRVLANVGLLPDRDKDTSIFEKEWLILKNKKPSDLSGGMRKRVGVARALVGSPSYIFYDEPTTGLDPVTSEQIDNLIASLTNKLKITSLVITHDMFSVFKIASTVTMLDKGKVQFSGSPEEMKCTNNAVVQEFLERYS